MNPSLQQNPLDLNIIFVTSGVNMGPYPPLEQAVSRALQTIVKKVTVISPYENLVNLVQLIHPDLVLVFHGFYERMEPKIALIRQLGYKTALWLADDPYYTDITKEVVPHYDYVFTQDLGCVSYYQSLGCKNVFHLPLAADQNVFRPMNVDPSYHSDICFIGVAFSNRIAFIDSIAHYLSFKNVIISGLYWDKLQNYSLLADKIRLGRWMTPEETASYYNGAKIVVNLHRLHDDPYINFNSWKIPALSINNRTFEISSCGAFQLTDVRPDLSNFYTPASEIETFTSTAEFINKVEYYLQHEDHRRQIALRGLERTRKEHTYEKRLMQLLNAVFS